MVKKSLRRVVCLATVCASVFGALTMFAGCTSSHPEVEMKLSFNGKNYTLDYKLYRNIAPATVQHFIELADKGYYDGVCVHNYSASALYTGGYTYDATQVADGGLVEKDYRSIVANYGLTDYVWSGDKSTYTLYGEFSSNGFEVKNGALARSFGALTMYYTPKKNSSDPFVNVLRSDGKKAPLQYKYNSATSLFSIAQSDMGVNSNYCTFATLKGSDSKEELQSLLDAIEEYIRTSCEEDEEKFAPEYEIDVDTLDPLANKSEVEKYRVPSSPIVIESVKVKSY